jgi:hypothetical protein
MKFAVTLSIVSLMALSLVPALASSESSQSQSDSQVALSPSAPTVLPMGANAAVGSRGLDLSDTQLESIHQLKNKLADDLGPKKLELSKQKRALKDLLTAKSIDKGSIQSTQDKINTLRADMANSMLAFKIDFQEQLTPDQREKVRAKAISGGGHRGMKRGKFHHRRMHRSSEFGKDQPTTGEMPAAPAVEETFFEGGIAPMSNTEI